MLQEFTQQVKSFINDALGGVHTAIPGKIISFDASSGEAVVLPAGAFRKPGGGALDFPQISGVPVLFPQSAGQSAVIAYPVKPGDGCLLVFAEQSLDTWKSGAQSGEILTHDLTNAVAIVGLFARASPLVKEACEKDAIVIDKDGKRITVRRDGVTLSGGVVIEGDITVNGNLTAENVTAKGALKGASADVSGSASVAGSLTAGSADISGALTAGGINMTTHRHTGNLNEPTSTPY
jgi:hypothetical protein